MGIASGVMKDLSRAWAGLMAWPGYLMNRRLETVELEND
jgi:hypothetical protein